MCDFGLDTRSGTSNGSCSARIAALETRHQLLRVLCVALRFMMGPALVRVQIDPSKLEEKGLTLDDVRGVVAQTTVDAPIAMERPSGFATWAKPLMDRQTPRRLHGPTEGPAILLIVSKQPGANIIMPNQISTERTRCSQNMPLTEPS